MKVGDVYWVEFPSADGHEQAGRRPAIVLQDDTVAGGLPVFFAIPLTASLAALRFAGTVRVDPSSENGLSSPSVALVFQLRAIDRRRLRSPLGTVSHDVLTAIFSTLDTLIGRGCAAQPPSLPPPSGSDSNGSPAP